MATKELLARLDFRRLAVKVDNVAAITVKYGASKHGQGHASAR